MSEGGSPQQVREILNWPVIPGDGGYLEEGESEKKREREEIHLLHQRRQDFHLCWTHPLNMLVYTLIVR